MWLGRKLRAHTQMASIELTCVAPIRGHARAQQIITSWNGFPGKIHRLWLCSFSYTKTLKYVVFADINQFAKSS